MVGCNHARERPPWVPTTADAWGRCVLVGDRFGRSDRSLPPQVVDGMFEDILAECLDDVP